LDPALLRRIAEVFDAVVELQGPALTARLAELCGADVVLRAEVERLLQEDRADSLGFVDHLVADVVNERALGAGDRVGAFTVLRGLGEGGMGQVYAARQEHPRRDVALKVLHPWQHSPAVRERFQFEANAMARLIHPGIPQVFDSGDQGGLLWIAMELVGGRAVTVHARGLAPDDRLQLAWRVCEAVGVAHQAGMVHRDLKPSNVLVDGNDQPKVLDFGLAADVDDIRAPGTLLGTPMWASPEQVRGDAATKRSDVWALGKICWDIVTGYRPLGDTLHMNPPAGVPLDALWVLRKAMSKDPSERYSDAIELASDLWRARIAQPVDAQEWTAWYRLQCWRRRHPGAVRLLSGAGIVAAIGLGIQMVEDLRIESEAAAELASVVTTDELRRVAERRAFADTRVPSRAWRELAAASSDDKHFDWVSMARAYGSANHPDDEAAALEIAVEELSKRWRWTDALPAVMATGGLTDTRAIPLWVAAGRAADAPVAETDPRRPMLDRLANMSLWQDDAVWVMGPNNRLYGLRGDAEMVELGPSLEPLRTWDVEGLQLYWPRVSMVDVGELYVLARPSGVEGITHVYRWGYRKPVATLPFGSIQDAVTAPEVEGGELMVWLATGPYERTVFTVDPRTWEFKETSPKISALGSDVMAVEVLQLDDDPEMELVLGQGPWGAYSVTRVDFDPSGEVASVRPTVLGYINDIASFQTPDGLRIAAVKSDRYRSRALLDRDGFGAEPGVYILKPTGNELEVERHLAVALPPGGDDEAGFVHVHAGDVDGDGLDDLGVWIGTEETDHGWLLRQTEDGFADILLPDRPVVGLPDVDGDGRAEVLVQHRFPDRFPSIYGLEGAEAVHVELESPQLPVFSDAAELAARARLLAELHLRDAAADMLQLAAERMGTQDMAQLLVQAAGFREDPLEALADVERAVALGANSREVREAQLRYAREAVDIGSAYEAAAAIGDPSVHALREGVERPILDGVEAWQGTLPGALRSVGDQWIVHGSNITRGDLELAVEPVGPLFAAEATFEIEDLDIGAELGLFMSNGEDQSASLSVSRATSDDSTLVFRCALTSGERLWTHLTNQPIQPGAEYTVRFSYWDAVRRCSVRTADGTTYTHVRRDVPMTAFDRVQFGVHNGTGYSLGGALRAEIRLSSLKVEGVRTISTPPAFSPLSPDARLDAALDRGDAEEAVAILRSGDVSTAFARTTLRAHGAKAEPIFLRALGDDFYDLYCEAWVPYVPFGAFSPHFDVVDRSWLDDLPITSPSRFGLRAGMGVRLLSLGRLRRAITLLEPIASGEFDGITNSRLLGEALEHLARAYVRSHRPDDAASALQRRVDLAPSPPTQLRVLRRDWELGEVASRLSLLGDASGGTP